MAVEKPGPEDSSAAFTQQFGKRYDRIRDAAFDNLAKVDVPPPAEGHSSVAVPPGIDASPEVLREDSRIFTIPNILTFIRLLLIPVFVVAIGQQHYFVALIVLIVGGLTDWLDGKIARWFNSRTKLGALMDPVADRLVVLVVLIAFVYEEIVPLWLALTLIGRDTVLLPTLLVYRRRGVVPEVIYLGKAATFALMYAFPFIVAGKVEWFGAHVSGLIGDAILLWGTGLYVWTGVIYLWQAWRVSRTFTVVD